MFNKQYLYNRTILPVIVYLVLLFLVPFVILVILSLTDYNLVKPIGSEKFIWFENYVNLFSDSGFANSILITFYFSFLSVLLQVGLGLLICEALSSVAISKARFYSVVYLLPIFIPFVIVGLIWRLILSGEFGVLSYYLSQLGFSDARILLSSRNYVIPVLSLIDTWQWAPFAGVLFFFIKSLIPKGIYEAAKIDGSSSFKTFFNITLPIMIPTMVIFIVVRFIECFKEFDKVYILTGGGPGSSSELISLFIWRKAFRFFDFGYSSAMSILVYLLIFFLSYALYKYINKNEN